MSAITFFIIYALSWTAPTSAILQLPSYSNNVYLRCYNGSLANPVNTNLGNPEPLITSGCIDTSRTTVFYVLGFKSYANTDTTVAMLSALFTKPLNVVLVDWSYFAYSPNITIIDDALLYPRAAKSANPVGEVLGEAMIKLTNLGLNLIDTIILGFSLGCHVAGSAGDKIQENQMELGRIVGVECANPLFDGVFTFFKALDSGSANSVACILSDPGYFSINNTNCHSNTYMNYRNYIDGNDLQPGCPSRLVQRGCSHVRGVFVVAEALRNLGTVLASGALTYWEWEADNGTGTNIIDLGNLDDYTTARGNYYFTTNAAEPFGRGTRGLQPN